MSFSFPSIQEYAFPDDKRQHPWAACGLAALLLGNNPTFTFRELVTVTARWEGSERSQSHFTSNVTQFQRGQVIFGIKLGESTGFFEREKKTS